MTKYVQLYLEISQKCWWNLCLCIIITCIIISLRLIDCSAVSRITWVLKNKLHLCEWYVSFSMVYMRCGKERKSWMILYYWSSEGEKQKQEYLNGWDWRGLKVENMKKWIIKEGEVKYKIFWKVVGRGCFCRKESETGWLTKKQKEENFIIWNKEIGTLRGNMKRAWF